jgi:hypothetical protein
MLKQLLGQVIGKPASKPEAADATPAESEANPLETWLARHEGRLIDKWTGYAEVYHRHFARFRHRNPVVMEIGVSGGGSLEMWRDYFGPGARIIGVDVNPVSRDLAPADTEIFIGDQGDRTFVEQLKKAAPHLDVLIDDGGHHMAQQLLTFDVLFPHLQPHGVYLCEDTHTSYWPEYGGGYLDPDSYMEYCKFLVDKLSAWHSPNPQELAPDAFTRCARSIHFYNSMVVIEKRPMQAPARIKRGTLKSNDAPPAPLE